MFNKKETEKKDLKVEKIDTPTKTALKNFFRNKLAVIGLITFISIFLVVFIGSSMTDFDANYNQPVLRNIQPGKGYLNFPNELEGNEIKEIVSGISFSAALTEEGKVYTWGVNSSDVLTIPTDIQEVIDNQKVIDISAGDRHIVLTTQAGEFYGWGYNSFNQVNIKSLSKGKDTYIPCPPQGCTESQLAKNPQLMIEKSKIVKVGASDQTTGVLTDKGQLVVWGATNNNKFDKVPTKHQGKIKDFKMSTHAVILLLEDGTVDVYGVIGALQKRYLPKELTDGTINVVKVDITYSNGVALDDQGKVYVWGVSTTPVMRMPKFDQKVVDIDAGREHVVALLEDGTPVTWGTNNYSETSMSQNLTGLKSIYSDMFQNYAVSEDNQVTAWGNNGFTLGSDDYGRDLLTRLLHGGRVSLTVGAIAVVIQIIIGVIVGMIAGFKGGKVDNLLMRLAEIIGAFPFYPLVITLSAMMPVDAKPQDKLVLIMVILGVIGWTGIARLVRGQILQEREKDFVLAARALGIKESNIIVRHILPNIMNIIIVQVTLGYAASLLSEAGLSFLGFGVPFPYPSWGNMLSDAQTPSVIEHMWWRWVFPGFMVFITALSVNIVGDGLRDALDPKSNER